METKTIKKLKKYSFVFLITLLTSCMNNYNYKDNLSFYNIKVKTIDGEDFDLSTLKGNPFPLIISMILLSASLMLRSNEKKIEVGIVSLSLVVGFS